MRAMTVMMAQIARLFAEGRAPAVSTGPPGSRTGRPDEGFEPAHPGVELAIALSFVEQALEQRCPIVGAQISENLIDVH